MGGNDLYESYKMIWTTDKDDYWLVKLPNHSYSIFKVSRNGFLRIEDDGVYDFVIQKMVEENAKQVSIEEFNDYIQTTFSDGSELMG